MGRPAVYKINNDYFKCIDTDNKAYIFGIISSDGSVCNGLSIVLSNKDIEILENLKSELNSTHPIKEKNGYVHFCISNKKIKKDLFSLGLLLNKSQNNLKFPNLEDKYISHYLRGIFDGDGSIYENNGEYTVSFSGGEQFLMQIKDYFLIYGINSYLRYRYGSENKNSCMLEIRGSVQIQKIFLLLYKDSVLFLKRKYNKFLLNAKKFHNFMKKSHSRNGNKEKIIELYQTGVIQKNIAIMLNIPYPSVRGIIQRHRKEIK